MDTGKLLSLGKRAVPHLYSVAQAVSSKLERVTRDRLPVLSLESLNCRRQDFLSHSGLVITPHIPYELGRFKKENLVIQDLSDPDHFNHFVSYIYHPTKRDPSKPVVIASPGMFCNGNLFRFTWTDGNFKDLRDPVSFANYLAVRGYTVAVLHPRYSEWIYTRYVANQLRVPNQLDANFGLEQLVTDLHFLIDAVTSLSQSERAVVLGFSLGGITLLNLTAFRIIDPRVAGAVFLGTPVEFSDNREKLISVLRLWAEVARWMPIKDYHALNFMSRHVVKLKNLLKDNVSPETLAEIVSHLPFVDNLFNIKRPRFPIETLIPFLFSVVEPLPSQLINELLYFLVKGQLIRRDTGQEPLSQLPVEKGIPPWLVIKGGHDHFVTDASHETLVRTLTNFNPQGWGTVVDGFGHVDSTYSPEITREVLAFLERVN